MVTSCSAHNCRSRRGKGNGLSFHQFPSDEGLRKKWLIAMRRKGFEPSKYTVLCSKHFTPDDYQLRPNSSYPLLKEGVIPTIFDFPTHLDIPPPRKRRRTKNIQAEAQPGCSTASSYTVKTEPQDEDPLSLTEADTRIPTNAFFYVEIQPKHEEDVPADSPPSPTRKELKRTIKILQQRLRRRDRKIKSLEDKIAAGLGRNNKQAKE